MLPPLLSDETEVFTNNYKDSTILFKFSDFKLQLVFQITMGISEQDLDSQNGLEKCRHFYFNSRHPVLILQ